jgi:hypothetical protein
MVRKMLMKLTPGQYLTVFETNKSCLSPRLKVEIVCESAKSKTMCQFQQHLTLEFFVPKDFLCLEFGLEQIFIYIFNKKYHDKVANA